ncbi:hypothetical protein [Archaeoglobus sp.]
MICPRCGGELQATSNPNKLQCRECGRVFKNHMLRYFRCERRSQGCYIVSPYEVPDSCPYGFSNSQFEEITPLNFVWGGRKRMEMV